MSYTLPSDEALLDAVLKLGVRTPRDERRAVARLAIEHFIAEAASGVDVDALARRILEVLSDRDHYVSMELMRRREDELGAQAEVGAAAAEIADALRTAIARAVARDAS